MKYHAVISGDIIASTSLNETGKARIDHDLGSLLNILKQKFKVYARVLKGDFIECYVPQPENALRTALLIKSYFKSLAYSKKHGIPNDKRFPYFLQHGIRLAIGLGSLSRLDLEKGIIDGDAIYFSGRTLDEQGTYYKEKIIIKRTLFFASPDNETNDEIDTLVILLDALLQKCTAKQCEIIFLKLLNLNETEIATRLNKSQSTVNQHSTSSGWNAIERAIKRFEKKIKKL